MLKLKHVIYTSLLLALPCSQMAVAHEDLRPAQRAYNHNGWNFVGSLGLTFGGDELIEVEVEDDFFGDDDEDVRAGESVVFAVGAAYQFYNSPLQLQATLGYHTDGIFADNGDTEFSRKPLELLAFYSIDRHRIGVGVTRHLDPEFDVDIDFLPEDRVKFDDATGFVVQYDFRVTAFFALGARFTSIEYQPEDPFRGPNVDGDHIGIMMTFLF